MSISKVIDFEQANMDKVFGKNDGYWQYRTFDDELLCYTVRKNFIKEDGSPGKEVKPWTIVNGKWVNKGFDPKTPTPIYNLHLLKLFPEKPVLVVEGEKTAKSGLEIYPQFNVITWLGGSQKAHKADWSVLKNKIVYIIPDNDEPGYKATDKLKEIIKKIAKQTFFVDIKNIVTKEGWDLDNLNDDHGEVDSDIIYEFIMESYDISAEIVLIDKDTFPVQTSKGNPLNTYENLDHLCKFYNLNPRFNVIRKEILMDMEYKGFSLANKAKLELAELTSLCIKNNVPRIDLIQWLTMIADKNCFNPVEDYILSKPWDGISRINEFFNTIQCKDNKIRDIYMYRWMIGALAVGLSKTGLAHPGVLTFISNQAKGKSSWAAKLVPDDLNLILGEFILNPDDKDSVIRATKYWIVELAEADSTVKKSEAGSQKAFLTRKTDQYRSPYDKADTEAPRHTVFIGTVNDSQFLKDETGNRRWWVLDVTSINYKHSLNMQQIWAEFKAHFDRGEQFHLTDDELAMLMNENESYRTMSAIEEAIRLRYDWESEYHTHKFTPLQVLHECGFDTTQNKNQFSKEANRVLKQLCKDSSVKINGLFYYYLPRQRGQEGAAKG